MANISSASCLIRSSMAAESFAFSCPSVPTTPVSSRRNVGCFCVVRNDGSSAQAAKGGVQAQITFSFANKVYEDQMKGIACYIDQNGEIICEGYDEGPRTDAEADVIELLERSWLQLASGSQCTGEAEYFGDDFLN
ncbi:hypothetical protein QQ045_007856 [Rhodiola kirilowii]